MECVKGTDLSGYLGDQRTHFAEIRRMPLFDDAEQIIKENLNKIALQERAVCTAIGYLTDQQHYDVNEVRKSMNLPELQNPEIVYIGRHHYESRFADGYYIKDMFIQIESSLSETSKVIQNRKMTALLNPNLRLDGYGNSVNDMAILELTQRKPRAELYSVIPKGDNGGPAKKQKGSPALANLSAVE